MASSFTTDDLTTPLTTDEVKASIYAVLAALGVSTTNWKPGAVVRTIIAAMALVIAALSQLTSKIARSGFLDLSDGDWLTLLARYVYAVERIPATFATGEITLSNSGGGIYALDPGDLVVTNPDTGKQYTNVELINIGALQIGIIAAIVALEEGADSTSFAGEITTVTTSLPGVTSTNAASVVGFNEEEDPALRTRCRSKLGALSPNGPADAYDYVARTATRLDGSAIGITRVATALDGYGGVDVYLAGLSGSVTGTVGDTSTDLGKVDDDFQRLCTPLTVTTRTHSASPTVFYLTVEIWLYNTTGMTTTAIQDAISAEVTTFMAERPIGGDVATSLPGKIWRSELIAVIGRARTAAGVSLGIFRVELTTPSVDISLAFDEAPLLGTITYTAIHQVTQ